MTCKENNRKKRGTCKIYVYAKEDEHYERSATVSIKVKIVPGKIKKIHLKRISGKQLKVTWKKILDMMVIGLIMAPRKICWIPDD